MAEKQIVYQSPGLSTLLTVLFVGLKLGGVIDWSWWWVLSPIWISIALAFVIWIFIFVLATFFNPWKL